MSTCRDLAFEKLNSQSDVMDDTVVIDGATRATLQLAKSDYVGLWQVIWELREHHGITDKAERRRLTLKIIDKLLREGLEVVDFNRDRGWERWPDQDPRTVIARVEHEWDVLGQEPNLGDICWFDLPDRMRKR